MADTDQTIPKHARVVVVGGGIVGCSTAYHLAKLGFTDVILLERHRLTSGSTWHAAGLVGQLRSQASITQLLGHSIALYNEIGEETGLSTGWKMNGGLRLACHPERMAELKRQATTAHSFGLEMHLLTPSEAQELWPPMNVDDVVGAAFLPTDGQANPSDITQALAKGARQRGVSIFEEIAVEGVDTDRGRVTGVRTSRGPIACEVVVNCCGQWAAVLGERAGVNVPLVSVQHQYLITEPIDGITPSLPTLRDPDRLTYYKEEVGGLVMGGYEPNPLAWGEQGLPEDFSFTLLESNWDHFEPMMSLALPRVPALQTAGVKELVNGPESFTPDGNFILGEAPECRGFYVAAGFNAFGIAAGGGAGKALAEWIVEGEPPYDLWPVDIRRFGAPHQDRSWVRKRTMELYGKHYTIAWPFEEHATGRPLRRSPLYETLKGKGACFGEKLGWERPNWFAPSGTTPEDRYSFGRQNWFEHVGREHHAARESAAIFDQSSFAKFIVEGEDACSALGWVCANNVDRPVGSLIYTQLLNQRGGIECDLTVTRLATDRYYLVTGTGYATHDYHWIRQHLPADRDVRIFDFTSMNAVLSLMGPASRDILKSLTDADLDNAAFPFATVRHLSIGGVRVLAMRVTYVGELGWELHVPVEMALTLYQLLFEAGEAKGIVNAGYRAIESLRLEKGYLAWGADLTPDHTPLEAGLGWAVKLRSEVPFMGRDALLRQREAGLTKLMACFLLDDPDTVLIGRETIYRDGERVGWLTSAGFGYTVGANIGYGYVRDPGGVDPSTLSEGQYELEVETERVPCRISLDPPYDPSMARVKG
jgi:sarcosine dehydrogenase